MTHDLALVIDTNSNYSDIWKPCFSRLEKHFGKIKKYVFTDSITNIPSNLIPVLYENNQSYRNQFLSCINQVPEKYILYTSEDYILYKDVEVNVIDRLCKILDTSSFSFVKLIKGPERTLPFEQDLFEIDKNDSNFFAQQASIWKTRDFEKIFSTAPAHNTRMDHEPMGSFICRSLKFRGLQYYANSPKRGMSHYDSLAYPYMATAVVKGKWNTSEYPDELAQVFSEYSINPEIRGVR